jgi:iron(III) transport system ATP-binding protein
VSEIVALERVSLHRFGRTVLKDVTLAVSLGETVVLMGPSGAGKSTLLRVILGFLDPDSGIVRLRGSIASDGRRSMLPPEERRIGMVFQDLALWPHLTVERHLAFVLRSRGIARAECNRRITETVARLGLRGLETRRPGELSGGEQQRVALARAIITRPDLLLLDEPLSQLDPFLREDLLAFLGDLFAEVDAGVLYVAHDPAETRALDGRIVVMERGAIVEAAPSRGLGSGR